MEIIGLAGVSRAGKDTVARILKPHGWGSIGFADALKQIAARIFDYPEDVLFGDPSGRDARDRYCEGRQTDRHLAFYRAGLLFSDPPSWFRESSLLGEQRARKRLFEVMEALFSDEATPPTPRRALQLLGTEWGRSLREDLWVWALMANVDKVGQGWSYHRLRGAVDPFLGQDAAPRGIVVTDVRFADEARAIVARGGRVFWIDAMMRLPPAVAPKHSSEPTKERFAGLLAGTVDNNGTIADLERTALRALTVASGAASA